MEIIKEEGREEQERKHAEQNPDEFEKYGKKVIALFKNKYSKEYKLNLTQLAYQVMMGCFFAEIPFEQAAKMLYTYHSVELNKLTEAEKRFIELERQRCTEIKAFYSEYAHVIQCIHQESGDKHHFQDERGIVYQVDKPKGTYVEFKELCINRTRYKDDELTEKDGSLSLTKARELGYVVEGK